jgi:pimeloyl-ACP methyl ester carboxylesterase
MPDIALALRAMRLSDAAYELDGAKRAALVAGTGAVETHYLVGQNDARALVAVADGVRFIAFQGTQFGRGEVASIAENLKVEPIELGDGRLAEAGYWQQMQDLVPSIGALPAWSGPLIVTGHSMGGCIAHLYAATQPLPAGTRVITFGAPKCGNASLWVSSALLPERWVHERDFAPDWPYLPAEWTQPAGGFYWMHDGAVRSVAGDRGSVNISVSDHMPAEYVDELSALAFASPSTAA